MLIDRVSLIPPIDGDRLSPLEARNEVGKLGNIKDESFRNLLVRNMASRYDIHEIEEVQKIANTQNLQQIQKIQQIQDIQNVQQIQNIQQIQDIQNIQQVQNIQKMTMTKDISEINDLIKLKQLNRNSTFFENLDGRQHSINFVI